MFAPGACMPMIRKPHSQLLVCEGGTGRGMEVFRSGRGILDSSTSRLQKGFLLVVAAGGGSAGICVGDCSCDSDEGGGGGGGDKVLNFMRGERADGDRGELG